MANKEAKKESNLEPLEQYDFLDDEHLDSFEKDYASHIGVFLIRLGYLEHHLNIAIAEVVNRRAHEHGYVIVERLMLSNKINLFYNFYLRLVTAVKISDLKDRLEALKNNLDSMNAFRNNIVHAIWPSIDESKKVRTKIIVGNEGSVSFRRLKILPADIQERTSELEILINELKIFSEFALAVGE